VSSWVRAKAAPLQALGDHTSRERIAAFEDSLPDVVSRLARRSLSESKRRGKVGSFRRRGDDDEDEYDWRWALTRRSRSFSVFLPSKV
jgi:hypothetical protein